MHMQTLPDLKQIHYSYSNTKTSLIAELFFHEETSESAQIKGNFSFDLVGRLNLKRKQACLLEATSTPNKRAYLVQPQPTFSQQKLTL